MPLASTNPLADSFYDDLVNISAYLYKKALTDLPTDVRDAIATAKINEGEMGKKFLNIMVKAVEVSDDTGNPLPGHWNLHFLCKDRVPSKY